MPVSCLALGTYELRNSSFRQAEEILLTALDNGINYIDTAPCYGKSEELIGNILHGRRSQFILASKCGCVVDGNPFVHQTCFTAAHILKNLEQSLRLLKTDYLDVWLLHGPSPEEIPLWENGPMLAVMEEAKQKGLVRKIGISCKNGGPSDKLFPDGFTVATLNHSLKMKYFDFYQTVYGALSRQAENALLAASQSGASIISRGAIRAYTPDYETLFQQAGLEELLETGETKTDFLLRFSLSHPGIDAVLSGTQNRAHLLANIRAVQQGPLSADIYRESLRRLDAVGRPPLPFPC